MNSSCCTKCGAETRRYPCAACGWSPSYETDESEEEQLLEDNKRELEARLLKRFKGRKVSQEMLDEVTKVILEFLEELRGE